MLRLTYKYNSDLYFINRIRDFIIKNHQNLYFKQRIEKQNYTRKVVSTYNIKIMNKTYCKNCIVHLISEICS